MPTLFRILLLVVCTAIGIAAALAVALQEPPPMQAMLPRPAAMVEATPPREPEPTPAQAPVIAPYRDLVASQVGELREALSEAESSARQREWSLLQAISSLQDRINQVGQQPAGPPPVAQQPPPPPAPADEAPQPQQEATQQEALPPARERVHADEGDDRLSVNVKQSDIRDVLAQLNQYSGLNIMASRNVQGTVTANLTNVSVEEALAAILKTTGFVARREGNILYIGTPADLALMDQTQDRLMTRVYRPNYIRAADLIALITPLLTPSIGTTSLNAPAEVDIPADQTKTGGNSYAGSEVVLVRDYEAVLVEIDQIFAEIDVKPQQIAIEAMILSVDLKDEYKLGVNFEALRDRTNIRLISGQPPLSLAAIGLDSGGLKFGFMDASLSVFIDALETIGETNVIASPRLTCLNKQRAEIQIGQELGYVSTTVTETTATQTVNFLDVGTLLRIRPFIGNDGLIRLEVHPELSTGSVEVQEGMSLPQKSVTQVTTNILCPDGRTIVIGGLIREDLITNTTQIPFLGSLPWVGPVFRQKTENVNRNEIIVLITPRIVSEPFLGDEGMKYGNQFTQRQSVYFDKMSPIARRNLGLHHLRKARAAYAFGDFETALLEVNRAIHYDPLSRDAITLRNEIVAAGGYQDESIHEYLNRGLHPLSGGRADYSKAGYPWKEFEGFAPEHPSSIPDPGMIGPSRTLVRPPPPGPAIRLDDGPPPLADPQPYSEGPQPPAWPAVQP